MSARLRNLDRLRSVSHAFKLAAAKSELFALRRRLETSGGVLRHLRMEAGAAMDALRVFRQSLEPQHSGWISIEGWPKGGAK